jgi:DNA polymerase-1
MTDRWVLATAEDGGMEVAPLGVERVLAGPMVR